MHPSLTTVAVLVLMAAAASCAPASLLGSCADVRSSSLELNRIAKRESKEARNGSTDVSDFSTNLMWIEARDMCDPETLRHRPGTCVEKIVSVLSSYNSMLKRVSGFQRCAASVHKLRPAMHKLQEDISKCMKSKAVMDHHEDEESEAIDRMHEDGLCYYTLDRLLSFSILTARVFAVGDPANHEEGSVRKCI